MDIFINMNLQESIRRILREVRVPRSERVELYKDENIIVVVPLTHRALKKYAHQCQWCINDDLDEWEDYHKGKHAVIIQRNPKKPKIGITGNPVASELFLLDKLEQNQYDEGALQNILDYQFKDRDEMMEYFQTIGNEISDFATNIVYYSPINGLFDQEDNYMWSYHMEISQVPNVTPEVIKIMDDYLQENKEMTLQESIKRILKEDSLKQSLIDEIKENGVLDSANLVGGLTTLLEILGDEFLTDNNIIKIIKEIVLTTEDEYITFLDMNENPLVLRDDDEVFSQIELLYPNDVAVFEYNPRNGHDMGEDYFVYEILETDILHDIFNMVINYYIDYLYN